MQTVVEGYYGLIQNITQGNLSGAMVRKWFPFLATVFLFIWFSNMLGYLPLPTNTEHKVDIFGLADPVVRAVSRRPRTSRSRSS